MAHQGNRGMAFESLINYTNKIYANKNMALIHKLPTPVKVLKSKGTRILSGFFEEKSTVDYYGLYNGKSVVFEAKSIKEKRFPLNKITDHQVEYLDQAEKQGAVSFLIIDLKVIQEVLIIPNTMLQKYVKDAKNGGRKSISLGDLEVYGHRVDSKDGIPLDYLSVVDRLIGVTA